MAQLQVELERFRVKKGKEAVAQEWMNFLNDHLEEVLQTLPGEKMYVESIFEEVVDETMYLYWVSYQGMAASDVVFSDSHVDQKHLAYWSECIDPSYGEHLLKTKVVMIQDKVKNEMQD
ncbi:DUF6176 family protein [Desemzia sp. C1]|uniref:NIPSNAP protein n=1 Tax=Desemzia incerta TaxID=82801 RepID=A0A1I5XLI1_9LACT|nr:MULTISPECIES: DUF6176 family protein [Desemzia]MCI3028990.1 DUF6176 family protein [Desemzia sp. C1]SFQ32567.1 hypothetical protein SAMN04488506_1460 [Desemzia incerta]